MLYADGSMGIRAELSEELCVSIEAFFPFIAILYCRMGVVRLHMTHSANIAVSGLYLSIYAIS